MNFLPKDNRHGRMAFIRHGSAIGGPTMRGMPGLAALLVLGTPALAQDEFQWMFDRYVDPDPALSRLTLAYAVPESEAVQFGALCLADGGGPYVDLEISADVTGLAEGDPVDVTFAGPGFSRTVPGKVVGIGRETGITGASLRLELDDPVWGAIRSLGADLRYAIAGRQPEPLPLTGAAAPTARFLGECAAMSAAGGARQPGGALAPGGAN
jgi:hypothetical protein